MIDPAEVAARPQVPADHPRQLLRRASRAGETIPLAAARPEPVDIDQFFDMFDKPTRDGDPAQNLAGFGNAFAGRGPQLNEAFGALRAAGRKRPAGPAHAGRPEHRLRRLLARAGGPLGDGRAGRRDAGRASSSPSTAPSPPSPASPGPYIQETIEKGPPTLDAAIADLPALRPFLHDSARFFTALQPGAQRPGRNLADDRRIAARRRPGAQRARRCSTPSCSRPPKRCSPSRKPPGVFNGLDLLIDTNELLEPGTPVHRPGADHLQLRRRSPSATSSTRQRSGNEQRQLAERHRLRSRRAGPNARAGPPPAPANGPERDNHLHFNPYPNTACPGPAARVRSGQRGLLPRQDRDRQRAREPVATITTASSRDRRKANEPPARARHQGRARPSGRFKWRPSNAAIAVIFILIFTIGPYLAFTGHVPFTSYGYELKATFANSANIALNSPVRIAGVEVGKVISTERDGDATTVTFTVDDSGRPIHDDAFAAIRPRIFLEGNFFVDLDPGSPSAPELDSGGTIPISHTSTAVQLDEVLTALQSPVRADLAELLESYGSALTHKPTAAEDLTQLPEVKGKTGAEGAQRGLQVRRRRRPLQRPGDQRPARHPAARPLAPGRRRRPHLRRLRQPRGRPAGPDRQLQHLHRRPRRPVDQPLDHHPPARADPADRPRLAGQPQPHPAAAAHLRDRADPGGRRAARPDRRLQTVARPGPAAALRQGGWRRREAAGRIDPGPRRRGPGGQGNDAAAAQPAQPLHDARSWCRPATRRSTTSSAPAAPTTASSSTARRLRRRRPELRRQRAATSASSPAAAPLLVGEPNPQRRT